MKALAFLTQLFDRCESVLIPSITQELINI